MVKKSVRNYSFLLFSVLLLAITAIVGLFLLGKNHSNKVYAQTGSIPVTQDNYDSNGNIEGKPGYDAIWTPGVGWEYVPIAGTYTGSGTSIPYAPGIDKPPNDGGHWEQNSTPCGGGICYQDATGMYQHWVSPNTTDTGGTGIIDYGSQPPVTTYCNNNKVCDTNLGETKEACPNDCTTTTVDGSQTTCSTCLASGQKYLCKSSSWWSSTGTTSCSATDATSRDWLGSSSTTCQLCDSAPPPPTNNCTTTSGRDAGCSCDVLTPGQCTSNYCGGPYSIQTVNQNDSPKIMGTCQALDATKMFCPSAVSNFSVKYTCSDDRHSINVTSYSGGGMMSSFPIPCNAGTICSTDGNACAYCATGTTPPTTLTCDPVPNGVIDNADLELWKKEYKKEVDSTKTACLSPNKVVDLLGFQTWKDIAVYKIKQQY